MKSIAIMQPYFLAYLGYFQLINAVDEFVIYDDVQFIKGGWINRNNFLIQGEKKMLSIQLQGASSNSKINEISILDNFSKFLKSIELNYQKAPFFTPVYSVLKDIVHFEDKNLANFIANSLISICQYLNIKTKILLSSQINKNCDLKSQARVIEICKKLNATIYINAIGGSELYSFNEFEKNSIHLRFIKSNLVEYKQFENSFIPWLSILDILMFNTVSSIQDMLLAFELTN